ncbi:hypothetical protein Tco_0417232 [Tanacetum coccineum]
MAQFRFRHSKVSWRSKKRMVMEPIVVQIDALTTMQGNKGGWVTYLNMSFLYRCTVGIGRHGIQNADYLLMAELVNLSEPAATYALNTSSSNEITAANEDFRLSPTNKEQIHNIDQDIQQAEHEYDESRVVAELRYLSKLLKRRKWS